MLVNYSTGEGDGFTNALDVNFTSETELVSSLIDNIHYTHSWFRGSDKRSWLGEKEVFAVKLPSGNIFDSCLGGIDEVYARRIHER